MNNNKIIKSTFKIEGMSCTSCSSIIEKKLKKTEGIISVLINFATEKATVEFDETIMTSEKIIKKIRDLGYNAQLDVNIAQVELKVKGMTCAACSNRVEKVLSKTEGVIEASVNLATEKAQVKFNQNFLTPEGIIERITGSGYQASVVEERLTEKVTLKIRGMSCTSCSGKIEKTLEKTAGIESVAVNFAAEKATIEYDVKTLRLFDLKNIIEKLGFEAIVEEEVQDLVDEDEIKLKKAKRKMVISLVLAITIMTLMMVNMVYMFLSRDVYLAITIVLGLPVVFGTGLHVHKNAFKSLKNKSANMDVLVMLGSLPPFLIGLLGFVIELTTFIEMAVMIMTFHILGKYLEVRAKGRASQAIKKLVQMGAKTAKILVDGEEIEVSVSELQKDDVMVIRPGEKIPIDGIIIEGSSLIDESMATGESMPVKREVGDEVIGATINKQGFLKVKVTKVGKDTFLSQIIKLVEECQGSKVPIQEFADKITSYFVPAIILITILTFISFNLFTEFHRNLIMRFEFLPWIIQENVIESPAIILAFITATAVLVISCPCALGLGTPTALMVGSGIGAEKGILIRNGEAVQTFKDVKCIAFDKTGTITKGRPEITDIHTVNITEDELLFLAGSIEKGSEHPLAQAIVDYAVNKDIKLANVKEFNAIVGKGVTGIIEDEVILIGNRKLMQDHVIDYIAYEAELIKLEEEAKTAMMVAKNGVFIGILAVADPLKDDSINA